MANTTVNSAEFGSDNGFRSAFANLRASVAQRLAYRRTYRELSRLSARELEDIGLHRCDIERACSEASAR